MIYLYIFLILLFILLAYIVIAFVIFKKIQKKMYFHRQELDNRITYYSYEEFGVERKEYIVNENGETIVGHFYFKEGYDKNKLVIFCHGAFSTKESYMQEAAYIASQGYLVYLFDYIGTNESKGENLIGTVNSLYSLDLVLNCIENDIEYKDKEIYVFGHSWGGYATLNIVKLHPNIKGIIGLAPMTEVFQIVFNSSKRRLFLLSLVFDICDRLSRKKKYRTNVIKTLDNYEGKIILVQSKDDSVIPFDASIGYIQKKLPKKDIRYIVVNNRDHNPDYSDNAVKELSKLYEKIKDTDNIDKLYDETDFHACGELDTILWDELLKKIFI